MCVKRVFFLSSAAGSIEGEGVLVISSVTFCHVPSLSSTSASDKWASSCYPACNTELTTPFIPWNPPRSVWESGLIHLCLKSLCHVENIISSHLHHCGSDAGRAPACFFKLDCRRHARTNQPCYNNQHPLIDRLNTTVNTLWHIDFYSGKGGIGNEIWRNCWPLVWLQQLDFQIPGVDSKDSGFQVYCCLFFFKCLFNDATERVSHTHTHTHKNKIGRSPMSHLEPLQRLTLYCCLNK